MKPTDPSSGTTIHAESVSFTINPASVSVALQGQTLVASAGNLRGHGAVTITGSGFLHEGSDTLEAHGQVGSLGSTTHSRSSPIVRPPGEGAIRRFADFFCSPETAELRFGALLADLERDYRAALNGGRRMQARWIVLKYWAGFMGQLLAPFGPVLDWIEKALRIIEKVLSIIEKVLNLLK
jgi:hypothetical protein